MRNKREVLQKYQELRGDRLRKRKETFLGKIPRNCQHNIRMRVKGQGAVGFCQNSAILNQAKTKVFVCNDGDTATRCRVFLCKNSHQSVEDDFKDILKTPPRCGHDYPKLAMLIWFLQKYPDGNRGARLACDARGIFISLWRLLTFRWW